MDQRPERAGLGDQPGEGVDSCRIGDVAGHTYRPLDVGLPNIDGEHHIRHVT